MLNLQILQEKEEEMEKEGEQEVEEYIEGDDSEEEESEDEEVSSALTCCKVFALTTSPSLDFLKLGLYQTLIMVCMDLLWSSYLKYAKMSE